MLPSVEKSFSKLKTYCEENQFKGWDPYDGLNSKVFQSMPVIRDNPWVRLAWIQFFKRAPVNLRKLFLIQKEYNPKALGLFITTYCNLYKTAPKDEYLDILEQLVKQTLSLASKGYSGMCWGYNFDWQSRLGFTPKYYPTVVATSFIGCALLEAYEILGAKNILESAESTAEFILHDLARVYDDQGNIAFSYSPPKNKEASPPPIVFNASLLGGRMLSRIYHYTREEALKDLAKKTVQYCINHQNEDGSWYYGTHPTQQWIDNFHTGYNLQCLAEYETYTGDHVYRKNIECGTGFYLNNFFLKEGIPKYYHNAIYPVDIHSPAQLIVTLYSLNKIEQKIDLVDSVLGWTIKNMQDKKGFFYYQITDKFTTKIPYMRWSQAWMMYAMSFYFIHHKRI